MKFRVLIVFTLLLMMTTVSTANPGGKGDAVRSRDCAGSCHASSSSNGVSEAVLDIQFPENVYAGLLLEIQTTVASVEVSSNNMVGLTLLINSDGAKDLPANDGWEIITDPNGGGNNYVEVSDSFSAQNNVSNTWTLRAPVIAGNYSLYVAVQHGSPDGGIAMSGISEAKQVMVEEVPENLPRLAADWKPINVRELGSETIITLETENTDSATVEMKNGGEITNLPVSDGKFTIPAAVNPGVVEWRVILEGEGPTQTSPWFRLTSQEPGWEVDEFALYLQGVSMLLLGLGLVIMQRPDKQEETSKYDNTDIVSSQINIQATVDTSQSPPIPEGGIPEGWTTEQWEYYGHEHLEKIARGEA